MKKYFFSFHFGVLAMALRRSVNLSKVFCGLALLSSLAATAASAEGRQAADNKIKKHMGFDPAKAPTTADWRYFMRLDDRAREAIWATESKRGRHLGGWSWGWRMGWVKTCATSKRAYCTVILHAALSDKALVVRAEAAVRLGLRHEGEGDGSAFAALAQAYKNPKNYRHGQPLYIAERLLYAMHLVAEGDELSQARTAALAQKHPRTRAYWQKLTAN